MWRHAVWRLLSHPKVHSGTLAVAPNSAAPYEAYLREYPAPKPLQVIPCGGATRQQTVRNALAYLPTEATLVAIHDAARPLLSPTLLDRLFEVAQTYGTAIPALPVQETLKRAPDGTHVETTVPRKGLYCVQTPQVFRTDWLRTAYDRVDTHLLTEATDDAQLLEHAGYPVHLVPGDPHNLKLTTPDDLHLLRALTGEATIPRIGIGYDIHKLTQGRALILGGVEIEHPLGLEGHSDADVVLHAICDALLGAAALGDIGHHFPNTDPRWKDASSLTLLAQVKTLLHAHGWQPLQVDATIIAEAPKLAPYIPTMRQQIAHTLGILPEQVSLKATTNEGVDAIGAHRAIACYAIATIYPLNGGESYE